MTDGEVAVSVLRHGLNIRTDARVLRNRLERYQMRRHFGSGTAPWNPVIDERSEIHEQRLISFSPSNRSKVVGHFSQARFFEILNSTGIFRPNVSATLDLELETRASTIGTNKISDRSKLNNQPRAQSTRCPLASLCDTGNSCCSQRSMDLERVASVPISYHLVRLPSQHLPTQARFLMVLCSPQC